MSTTVSCTPQEYADIEALRFDVVEAAKELRRVEWQIDEIRGDALDQLENPTNKAIPRAPYEDYSSALTAFRVAVDRLLEAEANLKEVK